MEAGTKPWTTFLAPVTSPPSRATAKSVWTVDFVSRTEDMLATWRTIAVCKEIECYVCGCSLVWFLSDFLGLQIVLNLLKNLAI